MEYGNESVTELLTMLALDLNGTFERFASCTTHKTGVIQL